MVTAKPVALLTKELKKTLATLMEDCGDAGRQQGYEALVANLAYDLAKSIHSNVTGYLILLQVRPLVHSILNERDSRNLTLRNTLNQCKPSNVKNLDWPCLFCCRCWPNTRRPWHFQISRDLQN